jgi:hypothetical protein
LIVEGTDARKKAKIQDRERVTAQPVILSDQQLSMAYVAVNKDYSSKVG